VCARAVYFLEATEHSDLGKNVKLKYHLARLICSIVVLLPGLISNDIHWHYSNVKESGEGRGRDIDRKEICKGWERNN
jgi:hypothetical protein